MDYTEMFNSINNELSTELITRQNELNKAIFYHKTLSQNKNENDIIKAKLIEKKIIELCERQKVVFNDLRKERKNASSNLDQMVFYKQVKNYQTTPSKQYIISNQTLLKPKNTYLNTGQKLLIPNESMTNTITRVVSTPGGGARLVTTCTNTTRSTLTKSNNGYTNSLLNNTINKTTQFNNFTITNTNKPITSTLTNNLNLQNSKIINLNDKPNLLNESKSNININKRKSAIQPLIDVQEQLIVNKPKIIEKEIEIEKPKIDENKVKEEFFSALGLLTKKALSEIQNKKSERKRRTTANPQFSSAAIEAKRELALELAAKKAKKREMAATNQDKSLNQQATRRNFLNSTRGKPGPKPGQSNKQVSKVSNNRQLNNQQQTKQANVSINCFVCGDTCDSDLDVIGFCAHCKLLFHVYCTTTVEKLRETNGYVPCPKCDRKKSINDELNNFKNNLNDAITSDIIQQQKLESNSSTSSSVISKTTRRRKISTQSKNNNRTLNNKINETQLKNNKVLNELSSSKLQSTNDSNKKDYQLKNKLLIRHFKVSQEIKKFKEKIDSLKDKVYTSKENKKELLIKKEESMRSIDTIVNLVKKIKEKRDEEQKENKDSKENKIDLVNEKLNNNLQINLNNDSNQNKLNNESNEENLSLPILNKNEETITAEAIEAVNTLSSLNNCDKLIESGENNLIKKEVELTDKEKVLMQDYTEDEKEVIQNLINYSNSTIHQDSQLNLTELSNQKDELKIESSNQISSQLSDVIVNNQLEITDVNEINQVNQINNNEINQVNQINDVNEINKIEDNLNNDEPPKKKICTPERKFNLIIEDTTMDEIDMAVASIPN